MFQRHVTQTGWLFIGLFCLCSVTGCGESGNAISGDASEVEAFLEANPELQGGSVDGDEAAVAE